MWNAGAVGARAGWGLGCKSSHNQRWGLEGHFALSQVAQGLIQNLLQLGHPNSPWKTCSSASPLSQSRISPFYPAQISLLFICTNSPLKYHLPDEEPLSLQHPCRAPFRNWKLRCVGRGNRESFPYSKVANLGDPWGAGKMCPKRLEREPK